MKASEQYFPVLLFIMLYKAVLTFESVDEILKYNHSNESYWAVLSFGTVCYTVKVVLTSAGQMTQMIYLFYFKATKLIFIKSCI